MDIFRPSTSPPRRRLCGEPFSAGRHRNITIIRPSSWIAVFIRLFAVVGSFFFFLHSRRLVPITTTSIRTHARTHTHARTPTNAHTSVYIRKYDGVAGKSRAFSYTHTHTKTRARTPSVLPTHAPAQKHKT